MVQQITPLFIESLNFLFFGGIAEPARDVAESATVIAEIATVGIAESATNNNRL